MKDEFTRRELYDLVWSQPMKTVAASIGISDVALAKQCKKANIPVFIAATGTETGRKAKHPACFAAALSRCCGPGRWRAASNYRYGSDWAENSRKAAISPMPTFDEDIASVERRAQTLIGKVRCQREFEPAHLLVAKILRP